MLRRLIGFFIGFIALVLWVISTGADVFGMTSGCEKNQLCSSTVGYASTAIRKTAAGGEDNARDRASELLRTAKEEYETAFSLHENERYGEACDAYRKSKRATVKYQSITELFEIDVDAIGAAPKIETIETNIGFICGSITEELQTDPNNQTLLEHFSVCQCDGS